MILKGSQRGGAADLAAHLMNDRDNDHVELHEVRGFVANDLKGALSEAYLVSKGTQCRQFMFSLSLNPPKDKDAPLEQMIEAADRAEERLGLKGQPRAVVVHEKEGRRHIHVVWSRIDVEEMKAVHLPHFKNRLRDLSKELYLENGWELPEGHRENGWKSPLNFTLDEWQQCKRLGLHPKELKQLFQDTWERSDTGAGFRGAMEERGYFVAAGDRRGFVAVDVRGEVFSLSRMTGAKARDLEARLGKPETYKSVEETTLIVRGMMSERLKAHVKSARNLGREAMKPLEVERAQMVERHRHEREQLDRGQRLRWTVENQARQSKLRRGIRGVFDILTGRAAVIRAANDSEAFAGYRRDRAQREELHKDQMQDRRRLQRKLDAARRHERERLMEMAEHVMQVLRVERSAAARASRQRQPDNSLEL